MSATHHGGITEYNAHNLYGLAMLKVTSHAMANVRQKRPFVLTRSAFLSAGVYNYLVIVIVTTTTTATSACCYCYICLSLPPLIVFIIPLDLCRQIRCEVDWRQRRRLGGFTRLHRRDPRYEFIRYSHGRSRHLRVLG